MICRKCGNEIETDSTFCIYCGERIIKEPAKNSSPTDDEIDRIIAEFLSGSEHKDSASSSINSEVEPQPTRVEKRKRTVRKKAKYKMSALISVICVVILCTVVGAIALRTLSTKSIADLSSLSWGMDMEAIASSKKYSGVEYEGIYISSDIKYLDYQCDFMFGFDDNNVITSVTVSFPDADYSTFSDLFNHFYEKYDAPYYNDETLTTSSSMPSQAIKWATKDTIICLVYTGCTDQDSLFSDLYDSCSIGIVYSERTETDKVGDSLAYSDENQCAHDDGCTNDTYPWGSYCAEHGCYIVGCEMASAVGGLCHDHYIAASKGVFEA